MLRRLLLLDRCPSRSGRAAGGAGSPPAGRLTGAERRELEVGAALETASWNSGTATELALRRVRVTGPSGYHWIMDANVSGYAEHLTEADLRMLAAVTPAPGGAARLARDPAGIARGGSASSTRCCSPGCSR